MSKVLVEKGGLEIKGIYLRSAGKPVFHSEFVKAQKLAHRIAITVELAKGRNFKEIEVDSINKLINDVDQELIKKDKEYIPIIKVTKGELTTKLLNEALAWHNDNEQNYSTEKVNKFMMENFSIITKFEEVGLFFEEDVCELTKIYTEEEILENVKNYLKLF